MRPIRQQHQILPLISRPDDAAFNFAFTVAAGYDPGDVVSWVIEFGSRYGSTRTVWQVEDTDNTYVTVTDQVVSVTVPLDTISGIADSEVTLADIAALRNATWNLAAYGAEDAFAWRIQGPVDFVDGLEVPADGTATIGSPITVRMSGAETFTLTILGNTEGGADLDGAGLAALVHAATEKVTLTANDEIGGADSASSYGLKKWKWSTISSAVSTLISSAISALNLGTLATQSGTFSGTSSGTNTGDQDLSGLMVKSANLSDLASASTARTNLGLGSLATQSGTFSGTSSGTNTGDQDLSTLMVKSANLSDLASASTARTNLGLATVAATGAYSDLSGAPTAFDPASPGAIGGTTPSTGAFTTLALTPPANTSGLTISGFSLTGSNAQSMIGLAGTWNTSGTATGFKLNITDTASNAASMLLDLQVGGTSKFACKKDGTVLLNGSGGLITVSGASNVFTVKRAGSNAMQVDNANCILSGGSLYLGGATDLNLARAAAATLQLGVNHATTPTAQTLKAHNVTTGTGAELRLSGGDGSVENGVVRTMTPFKHAESLFANRTSVTYSTYIIGDSNVNTTGSLVTDTGSYVVLVTNNSGGNPVVIADLS